MILTERLAISALREAGWYPNRRVDITKDLTALEQKGYSVFEVVIEFLQEYSGLTVNFDHHGDPDEAWFSGSRACNLMAPPWVEDYSRRAGVRLLPVGAVFDEHLTLLIGADGSWYGGFDDIFGSRGANFFELIENIIKDEGFLERL
jgi:hypothetical protein